MLNGAQSKPTGGMLERFEDLRELYSGIVSNYEALIAKDLPDLNAVIREEQADGIIVPYTIDKQDEVSAASASARRR